MTAPSAEDRYDEARRLLERAQHDPQASRRLDVTASAEALLQRCADVARSTAPPSSCGPLPEHCAGRGARYAACPGAPRCPSPGHCRGLEARKAIVDRRLPDAHGRRKGTPSSSSADTSDKLFRLVVLEAFHEEAIDSPLSRALRRRR